MVRVILALVFGILIGFAVGFVAFQDSGSASGAVDISDATHDGARRTANAESPAALASSDAPRDSEAPVVLDSAAQRTVETVREEAKADVEAATGDGVISGTVVDADGNPFSGVIVRATPGREWEPAEQGDAGVPKDPSLDDNLRDAAQRFTRERAGRRETKSGAAGEYRIEGLAKGRYAVAAFAPGFVLKTRNGGANDIEPGATVNFRALPLTEIPAEVLLPDGSRATRATIQVETGQRDEGATMLIWTRGAAHVRLADGAYHVRAIIGEKLLAANGVAQELASPKQDVNVTRGTPNEPLTFKLEVRRGIRGRVVIPDDEKIDSIPIRVAQMPARGEIDPTALTRGNPKTWIGGWSPRFEVLDLAPGRWAIGITRGWEGALAAQAIVDVGDRIENVVLEMKPLATKESFLAHVRDAKGQPVRGVQFMLRTESNIDWLSDGSAVVEQKPGDYAISPADPLAKQMAGGEGADAATAISLIARSEELGSLEMNIAPAQRELTFSFAEPAWLELLISNYAGSGLEGQLQISLAQERRGNTSFFDGGGNSREVNPDGTIKLGPLAPGRKSLVVNVVTGGNGRYTMNGALLTQPVDLVAGTNRLTIALPATYPLVVKFAPGAANNGNVSIRSATGESRWARVENDAARFEHVAAGDYTVQVNSPNAGLNGQMRVRVPAQSEVTFTPDVQNALRVRITDQNGVLARRGLADGDVVIGIDGVEFTDEASMRANYYGAFDRDKLRAIVLRGGKRIEIELSGKELSAQQGLGGSLNPSGR